MKADGTCMLCDFGFALQISGSKYYTNGLETKAEADSLTEVSTRLKFYYLVANAMMQMILLSHFA